MQIVESRQHSILPGVFFWIKMAGRVEGGTGIEGVLTAFFYALRRMTMNYTGIIYSGV